VSLKLQVRIRPLASDAKKTKVMRIDFIAIEKVFTSKLNQN
jgi:hypothetical protein